MARRKACYAAVLATRSLDAPPLLGRGVPRASQRGRHLAAASRALAAAQDLLATHVAAGGVSAPAWRSPWAPALASAGVSRAVVAEMADLAGRAARLGSAMAAGTPAGWQELQVTRRGLAVASRHLRTLAAIAGDAHRQDPVLADDAVLLRGFRLRGCRGACRNGSERLGELCDGVVGAAERVRQSAWVASGRSVWSPSCGGESLRYVAASGVAVTEHCRELLRLLDQDALLGGAGGAAARAGQAAEDARDAWLRVARTLDQVTPDVRGYRGQEVSDADDLAVWCEHLTHGLPVAAAVAGPAHRATDAGAQVRTSPQGPLRLAGADVAGAVHHAADAMSLLAEVHGLHARKVVQARRFLAPSWSLPDYYDKPLPYALAPPDRVDAVISAYDQAYWAGIAAQERAAELAELTGSPSRALTLARNAAAGSGSREAGRAGRPLTGAGPYWWIRPPGHLEHALQVLGVTDPIRLGQARTLDHAGQQLVATAGAEHAAQNEAQTAMPREGDSSGPGLAGADQTVGGLPAAAGTKIGVRQAVEREAG